MVVDSREATGAVAGIYVAGAAAAPMTPVDQVRAVMGKGLEGDRYFAAAGTYSGVPEPGREVTLVEIEAIEAVQRDFGVDLAPRDTRRNVVTRGVRLNDLVGREFKVGEALLRGTELCEPCAHMAQLAGKNVVRGLVHRGGLRADILADGVLRVGDPIEAIPAPSGSSMEGGHGGEASRPSTP